MKSTRKKIMVGGIVASFMICGLLSLGVHAEKVVLRYADTPYGESITTAQENWIESFMIRYPNIKIKTERVPWDDFEKKYSIQAAAGTLPDILYLQGTWMQKWIRAGYVIDLMPYVEQNESLADLDDFFSAALKLYRYKGGLYGLPMDTGPEGIHGYNVELFEKAGLSPPDKSWTLKGEFLEAAKKLTKDKDGDGEVDQWGIVGGFYGGQVGFTMEATYLMPFGGRYTNEEETECLLTKPESIEALQFWLDLVHKYHVAVPYTEYKALEERPFALGKVGMCTSAASWSTYGWERFKELRWDAMHAPKGPAGRFTSIMGSCYAISKDSKHPDEAWLFLRDYMSREGLTYVWALSMSGSCARKSAWIEWERKIDIPKHLRIFREAMQEYGVFGHPLGPAAPELHTIFSEELKNALMGKINAAELARRVKKRADEVLAEYSD